MITDLEKSVYNIHLMVSRQIQGKPYKYRQDFSTLEENVVIILQKLARFFVEHPQVNMSEYFKAPHMVYPDESYYPIEFYLTAKAKKCYSSYKKMQEISDPDTKENLQKLQESLMFVYKYCEQNGIDMDEYQDHHLGVLPVFIDHLKNHHISFYTLHALTFQKISVESQILDFAFGDFYITFQKTKNKFYASKKMKEFAKLAKTKLNNKLKENRKNNKNE